MYNILHWLGFYHSNMPLSNDWGINWGHAPDSPGYFFEVSWPHNALGFGCNTFTLLIIYSIILLITWHYFKKVMHNALLFYFSILMKIDNKINKVHNQ
jgi:hypothetical protein